MEDALREALGHEFRRPALLEESLTHRSAAHTGGSSYERLEFLGDRILGFVVADLLLEAYPDEEEGALARRHVDLVRRETLADVAREVGLGPHIVMSRGEAESGGRENDAILADACEAVIAALYCDGGIGPARAFVERYWVTRLEATSRPPQDAKTTLQEWAQGRGLPLPEYSIVERTGPDHQPVFTVSVAIDGRPPAEGQGTSKRAAEQAAAERLLERIAGHG